MSLPVTTNTFAASAASLSLPTPSFKHNPSGDPSNTFLSRITNQSRASSITTPVTTAPSRRIRFKISRQAFKEIACHISLIAAGWSDATAGVLIPEMQAYYKVTGYAVIAVTLPFPAVPCAYAVSGFGMALQDAAANGYIVGLPNATQKLGYLHGFYGLGALIAPLVGTAFVDAGILWSRFYLVSLGIGLTSATVIAFAFRFEPEALENEQNDIPLDPLDSVGGAVAAGPTKVASSNKKMKEILTSKLVWPVCLSLMVYVGAEVTIGGWTVTFLQEERNGGTRAGYVASGFWAGITLGRVVLPRFNLLVGEKMVIFVYLGIATALELVVWLVPSFIGNAVAVGLVGFVMGPFYPNALSLTMKLLPRYLHTGVAGFVASFGQTGSAIFPFVTGALAQRYSPTVLQPMLLGMFGAMALLWLMVPAPMRPRD